MQKLKKPPKKALLGGFSLLYEFCKCVYIQLFKCPLNKSDFTYLHFNYKFKRAVFNYLVSSEII